MSNNQGKDGEMRFAIVLAAIAIREDDLEYTRHTKTNQADLGVDFSLQGSVKTLVELCEIGVGKALPSVAQTLGDPEKMVKARVDVKTTKAMLQGVIVDKFVSDIKIHPDTKLHLLVGGERLTKSAEQKFEMYQKALCEHGKSIVYIPNEGAMKLANEYKPEINSTYSGLPGTDQDTSEDEGV